MQAEKFHDLPLEDVIGDRFGRYSKYIIQERALPDARDGLKPVQRRILYSMFVEGNTADKPFRKSAKTVGNVIGNYHPHGDSSVYDAMVRLSQDWKIRNVLVEMHGNNGSMDGDTAAAMRYTEARLSAIAGELLKDIDKKTVEFIPNFDDSIMEPVVLPAMYPNLLVNGSTGISAGYATDIPPHQLGEVIDATIMRIDKENCTVDELITVMKGPDFPTGAIIQGLDGIKKAYETGKGKIIIRSKTEVEQLRGGKQQIVVTEIPYEVNKANLVKKIDDIRLDKKIDGIVEVRDETDRTGLRIVIELKKDSNADSILQYLYKSTELQVPYNFNMVAISDKHPRLMSLPMMLDAYIAHQKEVVTNRSKFELEKARDRQHIVAGLMKALSILDQVIQMIRGSKDKKDAKNNLIAAFSFTEPQAEAIVSLQLYRLTNTDITSLEKEAEGLNEKIAELTAILESEKKLFSVIKNELKRVKKTYNDTRRTEIQQEIEEIKIAKEMIIPQEDVIVTVTKEGYVKRTSLRSYSASNGKDFAMKESDYLLTEAEVNTLDTLLLFTNKGNYIYMPVNQLPDIRWKDLGQHITSIVPLPKEEVIMKGLVVKDFAQGYLLFATKNGMVKKSELAHYKVQRYSRPLVALNVKDDDEVVDVYLTDGVRQILFMTNRGYVLTYNEDEVSTIGVKAAGVKGINLKVNDYVVRMLVVDEELEEIAVLTNRGAGKKMKIGNIEQTSRAKRGVVTLRELKNNPHRIVHADLVKELDIWHIRTEKAGIKDISLANLKVGDQYSNGSFYLDTEAVGEILEVWKESFDKERE